MTQRVENRQLRARAQADNSRRRKKRRRGRRTLHFALLILFLVAAGAVLSLTVFFKIEDVRVVGTDKYAPDEVAAASGIQIEDNLLRIDKAAVETGLLEKYPYIESLEVRRKLPPAVEISITQANPEAAIVQGDQVVLINREGKVLERGILLVPDHIPVVRGIQATGVQPGQYLREEETEKLTMLRYLLEAMEQTGFSDITNVDLADPLNIRVMYENRLELVLGTEADLPYKLLFIKNILEEKLTIEESGTLNAAEAHSKGRLVFSPGKGSSSQEQYEFADTQAESDTNGDSWQEGEPDSASVDDRE